MRELVLREKSREMQRPIRSQRFRNPAGHPADAVKVVRVSRHDEVDDLKPYAQAVECLERGEDGGELAGIEFFVGVLVEAFQVHMRGVRKLIQVARGALLDGAAGDDDVFELPLARQLARVLRVFVKRRRFGVSVGNGRASQRLGHGDDVFGKQAQPRHLFRCQTRW